MNKKILNFALLMIVILIVIIFSAMMYYMIDQSKATNSIYDDVHTVSDTISDNVSKNEVQTSVVQTINVNDEEFEKIYPFTGAFPEVDIVPFIFEKEPVTTFSNEQILNLGFSKVTKDDWASTYISEGEPVSIPASLLDGYIKDIFGQNVQYQKANFSNTNYSIDKDVKSFTMSANVVYVPETDTYTINLTPGDGIGENHVYVFEPTISKIHDNLEVEIPYAYVVYADEQIIQEVDGIETAGFAYTLYANCDYETKTFSEELGSFSEFDVNEEGEFDMIEIIEDLARKNLSKIQKIRLIYSTSEDGTELVLKEIKK